MRSDVPEHHPVPRRPNGKAAALLAGRYPAGLARSASPIHVLDKTKRYTPTVNPAGNGSSGAVATAVEEYAASTAADPQYGFPAPLGGLPKRILDIFFALVAIVLLAPLMLLIIGLITLVMGRPVIFSHPRVGHAGRTFNCYKFRTMVSDSEQILADHLANNPQAAQEWRETRKLRVDPRITPLGRILRKSSLDELPQLINVLRGEMSLVGPRPIMADELEYYGNHALEYLSSRPGLTGLWQVNGRSAVNYAHRVALDAYYVRNWSTRNDFVILCKTVFVMLKFDDAC